MKIYGFLILMTIAVILLSTSEVSALENACTLRFCPANNVCINHNCVHRCERPNRDDYDRVCGQNAKCNKPGERGARCVCEDNWTGDHPDLGCLTPV